MDIQIELSHEISKEKNNRVVILHPNGEMDVIASPIREVSHYHMLYFKQYLNTYHLDDEVLQKYKNVSTQPGIIIYFLLKKYGDIIFTETTKDEEEKRYGILYFPDSVTEEQIEKMEEFKKNHFNHFSELLLQAEYYINDYNMIDNKIYEHIIVPDFTKLDELLIPEKKIK